MKSRLEELVIDQVGGLLDPTIEHFFGAKYLARHEKPRRIVWVRAPGNVEFPRQAGGRAPGNEDPNNPQHRIMACCVRIEMVDAYVYGENDLAADMMLDLLLAALFQVIPAGLTFGGVQWPGEQRSEAGETVRTNYAVLRVGFRCPVPSIIKELHPLAAIDHQCGTLDDQGNFTPQPGG